jgi:cytochrome c-type biogenesis protein CcmE
MQITPAKPQGESRMKFVIGGLLILAAVVYLIVSSTQANAQYFLTIDEMNQKDFSAGNRELRVSGAVIGDTITYDPATLNLSFDVAHIPGSNEEIEKMGGLAQVLHDASINPKASRIKVVYNGPRPDLLKDEAQAIMTGHMGTDGIFYANELLLKCPTRYEEAVPSQAAVN